MIDSRAVPLVEMFESVVPTYDLRQGTTVGQDGVRDVYLSTDVLRGIHEALVYEAGDAWGLILHRCGALWGERVTNRLWREAERRAGATPDAFPVDAFLAWMREWFRGCGWGDIVFDLRDAEEHGVVWVMLYFSLFRDALEPAPPRADFLVAGLLQAFFSKVAGQPLGACELPRGPEGEVVIAVSGEARIEKLSELLEDDIDLKTAREALFDA